MNVFQLLEKNILWANFYAKWVSFPYLKRSVFLFTRHFSRRGLLSFIRANLICCAVNFIKLNWIENNEWPGKGYHIRCIWLFITTKAFNSMRLFYDIKCRLFIIMFLYLSELKSGNQSLMVAVKYLGHSVGYGNIIC